MRIGSVTGHDFSRADEANRMNMASAPAGSLWGFISEDSEFFAACLATEGRTCLISLEMSCIFAACPAVPRIIQSEPQAHLQFHRWARMIHHRMK
jgi:hypothetical protein